MPDLLVHPWLEQVCEPDPVQHLVADAVDHAEGDLGTVLGRIDMDAERPLAERVSTTLTIATNGASASSGAIAENAFMICSLNPA